MFSLEVIMKRKSLSILLLITANIFASNMQAFDVSRLIKPVCKLAGAAGIAYVGTKFLQLAAESAHHLKHEYTATPNFNFHQSNFAKRYAFTGLMFLGGTAINAGISILLGHSALKDIKKINH